MKGKLKMHSIYEKYPTHNQECFCKLDSGLYRVYWYDSEHRAFMNNGALVNNITFWIPVNEVVSALEEEKKV